MPENPVPSVAAPADAEALETIYRAVLDDMAAALDACLSCEGLDFTAEHDGERALARYRKLIEK